MTHQKILNKAIQKAIDGGWKPGWVDRRPVIGWDTDYSTEFDEGEGVQIYGYHAKSSASIWFFPIKELIFNHDFARALWGESRNLTRQEIKEAGITGGGGYLQTLGWQYHLQQMVIADDPIKYLSESMGSEL